MASMEDARDAVVSWFEATPTGLATMRLPWGWLGAPYDNLYRLTWCAARPRKLLIELDEQLLLVLTEPVPVTSAPGELVLGPCGQVTLDRQGYGDLIPHARHAAPGQVWFETGIMG